MEKILKKLKKLLRLIFGRTTLGTLFLLIQILVLFAGFDWFREYLIYMYGGSAMLSALVLIYIIRTFYRIRRCWHTMRASAPAAAISSAI